MKERRTLVKIEETDNSFSVRTISGSLRSPHRFYILKSGLEQLGWKNRLIANDICSFAVLQKRMQHGMEILQIDFNWLGDTGNGALMGRKETVSLPFSCFETDTGNTEKRVLSLQEKPPRIEFFSRKNLKQVAEKPVLRKKLGKFLARHFAWHGYERIEVTDDFCPYSFFFTGYTPYGAGICGGIILHGQDNLQKAYYGMHT